MNIVSLKKYLYRFKVDIIVLVFIYTIGILAMPFDYFAATLYFLISASAILFARTKISILFALFIIIKYFINSNGVPAASLVSLSILYYTYAVNSVWINVCIVSIFEFLTIAYVTASDGFINFLISFILGFIVPIYIGYLKVNHVAFNELNKLRRENDIARTRSDIGRFLHDGYAKHISTINVLARRAQIEFPTLETEDTLSELVEQSDKSFEQLVKLIDYLTQRKSGNTQELGSWLVPDIKQELQNDIKLLKRAGFEVKFLEKSALEFNGNFALVMLLVIGELTLNILKYGSRLSPVYITLSATDTEAIVVFKNRVSPKKKKSTGNTGLTSLTSRLSAFGGTLDYGLTGKNWVGKVCVPLNELDVRVAEERNN